MKTTRKSQSIRARDTLAICGLALALAIATGACGQRGPLYLPDSSTAGEKAANDKTVQGERSPEERDQENDSEDEKTP